MRVSDIPAKDRILSRLAKQDSGCWHWTGVIDKGGYGRVGYRGRRSETIQRAVYDAFIGPIPDGHDVDHTCHNADTSCMRRGAECLHRRCGNPEHLEAVPRIVNGQRAKSRVTRCPWGHEYTADNTYTYGRRRFCRTCAIARAQGRRGRSAA